MPLRATPNGVGKGILFDLYSYYILALSILRRGEVIIYFIRFHK